jgi:hypothetical protein
VSKSQVSRLCKEIDEPVKGFPNRPIQGKWPYVWIDATYVKVARAAGADTGSGESGAGRAISKHGYDTSRKCN